MLSVGLDVRSTKKVLTKSIQSLLLVPVPCLDREYPALVRVRFLHELRVRLFRDLEIASQTWSTRTASAVKTPSLERSPELGSKGAAALPPALQSAPERRLALGSHGSRVEQLRADLERQRASTLSLSIVDNYLRGALCKFLDKFNKTSFYKGYQTKRCVK